MNIDIALRDIILVFSPILLVNIWTWIKTKRVKKNEVDILRKTFINELLRIEAKLITQINLVKESKDKFHVQSNYFRIEPFKNEISWHPYSKILEAYTINSKYTEESNRELGELVMFTAITNAHDTYASLKLTIDELRSFVTDLTVSENAIIRKWTFTYEKLVEKIIDMNEQINSGHLKINSDLKKRISHDLNSINKTIDFTLLHECKDSLGSFLGTILETNRLSELIPITRELGLVISELEVLKPQVDHKLEYYSEFMNKAKSNIRDAANLLQTQTKTKSLWHIS